MHRDGQISDCAVKKLDVPRIPTAVVIPPPLPPEPSLTHHDSIQALQKALDAVRRAAETDDEAMRKAFIAAGLRVVVATAQRMIDEMEGAL
jgi:hypothetical protein